MIRRISDIRLTHDQWAAGDAVGLSVGFIVRLILPVAAISFLVNVAHVPGKDWSYPWECCRDKDCAQISSERVNTEAGGYVVDGRFHIPHAEVRSSPDGNYHACFPSPEFLRCFFAPPPAS
jgi:hypothetical protein